MSFTTCSLRVAAHNGAVLVLDAGTTGVKAFVFDGECKILAKAYKQISKTRPQTGWVEQDPREIVRASLAVMRQAVKKSGLEAKQIRGFGITNQREATIVWNKRTGKPIYPVIGWEDARTKALCRTIDKTDGKKIRELTGLPVDSYFSATKIRWMLDHVPTKQPLAFGTIDSWLLYNLCNDRPHVTDETNASRTLLFNIRTRRFDDQLLHTFDVPRDLLPTVLPSRAAFGVLDKKILGTRIPVVAVCGDQQSSLYAASRARGVGARTTKITYGTGSFVMQNVGKKFLFHPPFFTTLTPGIRGTDFAVETKVEGSAMKVAGLLQNPKGLKTYLHALAKKIDQSIQQLPTKPSMIVADGGVARDGIVVEEQQKISDVRVCLQQTFDGTALGTALLVWDALDQKL